MDANDGTSVRLAERKETGLPVLIEAPILRPSNPAIGRNSPMEKRVERFRIKTTTDGMIDLIHDGRFQDDGVGVIRIHPDQVELVSQGPKKAKAELKDGTGTVKMGSPPS